MTLFYKYCFIYGLRTRGFVTSSMEVVCRTKDLPIRTRNPPTRTTRLRLSHRSNRPKTRMPRWGLRRTSRTRWCVTPSSPYRSVAAGRTKAASSDAFALHQRHLLTRIDGTGVALFICTKILHNFYPTLPSISSSINLLSSSAYSSGSDFTIGSINPETTRFIAASSESPRDCR